jgi:hypothetical protein
MKSLDREIKELRKGHKNSISRREFREFKDSMRSEFKSMTANLRERSEASKEAVQLALASVIRPEDKEGSKTALVITSIIAVIGILVAVVMIFKK